MEVIPFPQRGQIVVLFFLGIAFKELDTEFTHSKKVNFSKDRTSVYDFCFENSIQLVQVINNLGGELSCGSFASEIRCKFGSIFTLQGLNRCLLDI
jgi:hypothetical protein